MAEARHLHVVDPRSGEILESCPTCDEWARKYNGVLSQLGQMRAEIEADAGHELFPAAKRLHDYWRERCNHPRSKFTVDCFKQVKPRLKEYGEDMCRRAIEGAAYDCFTSMRKNGTVCRHDKWHQVFSPDKFEEFSNKAPYHLPSPEKVKTLADALMHVWSWEPERAVAEAQRRLT